MTIPIRAGEDEEPFRSVGWIETLLFSLVLLAAVCIIGVLTLVTWFVQVVVSISEDPNAGPYRQVR